MFCPRCGTEARPDQRFCAKCGAGLGDAEGAQSAAAPVAAQAAPEVAAGAAVLQPELALPVAAPTLAAPALTHPIPDGGLTLEEVIAWLQSGGYAAKVVTREDGKRHIESWSQGTLFNIFTPGCQSGRCSSLELVFAFSSKGKFDVSRLNEWNSDVPWGKAYSDEVNDPCLDMDISLSPGGTFESLNDQFGTWNNVLSSFITKYGLR
jgi:Putative bacterial sensory transduction regulator/zinc-ribbon domain